jgi:hypothetical protein
MVLEVPCLIGGLLNHCALGSLPIWLPLVLALVHLVQVDRRLTREPGIDFASSVLLGRILYFACLIISLSSYLRRIGSRVG